MTYYYLSNTYKEHQENVLFILEKQLYLLVQILEKKTNPTPYKLQMYFRPKLSWFHPKITYENIVQKNKFINY